MRPFWRLLGFLRPYRGAVIASFVLAGLAMAATTAIPLLTGRAIDEIGNEQRDTLVWLALAILATGVLRTALAVGRRIVSGRVSLGVQYDLRKRLYDHLQTLEVGFFDDQQTGQLTSRLTVDLQAVRFFLGYGLIFIVQSALTIALAAVAMTALDPTLALLALWPVPFIIVTSFRYGRRARPATQEVQQRMAELTAEASENVSGVRVVKAFAREARQLRRFEHRVQRVFTQAMVATRLRAFYNPAIAFLPNLGLAAVLVFGGRLVIEGDLSVGDFTAFYAYLLILLSPMRTLGVMLSAAQRATASGVRIFEVLDRAPRIVSAPDAAPLPDGDGRIELRGASLRFEGAATPAVDGIDLVVEAGSTVALVGPSGAGKTALTSLVPRLYDVTEGAVLVDRADVRDVELKSLRQSVAVVADDPFLFSASVHENIAYGRPDASRDEVLAAARRAQAHAFVEELPDGYETLIGERGLTLSGGQRQRLAIARALLADPRILILDDATSSVDASTERAIKRALREVMEGRTTIVIAHRRSTLALADTIVVLEDGRITAQGSHAALLEESELYQEIVARGLPDTVFLTRDAAGAGL